ncbi:MAG TPA: hypothetical protein VG675_05270 [Bryobacteraceae bacterium]|nr:hypothetical protein [Bryobacteraceae bacterium]
MKRAVLFSALLLSTAGYVFLQTTVPSPSLSTLMPGGALLYLEAPDFGHLVRDWNTSKVKADWLQSANYEVFSRSNLFAKLQDVYSQYGAAAGILPGLQGVIEIAGTNSALALYGIRDVEFLYVSRIGEAQLVKSQLWALRDKFEQRQAGGVSFYLRTDAASKRTVAFAFTRGYFFLATRDDLVAQALELLAGGSNPSIASDRWYHDAVAAASSPGDLRLVMNLELLVKSVYFRSYWVQRNASQVRQYRAGVADSKRSATDITESRVFLRAPESAAPPAADSVSDLVALVPPDAELYKAWHIADTTEAAALIVQKLIGPQRVGPRDWRAAPFAASPDSRAGSEADLETRIDEQPLPADAGISDSIAAARAMAKTNDAHAALLVQSSSAAGDVFMQTPSVIVLEGGSEWNGDSVRSSLAAAAGRLWTTSQIGAAWITGTVGQHAVERLDGLGTVLFAIQGKLLFLSNDSTLLRSVLDRAGASSTGSGLSYAAGFRHSRERANYERIMAALDFTSPAGNTAFVQSNGPSFFSGNLASLSRVLSGISEIRIAQEEKGSATVQTIVYQLGQ